MYYGYINRLHYAGSKIVKILEKTLKMNYVDAVFLMGKMKLSEVIDRKFKE